MVIEARIKGCESHETIDHIAEDHVEEIKQSDRLSRQNKNNKFSSRLQRDEI